jgi:hypothetical protein
LLWCDELLNYLIHDIRVGSALLEKELGLKYTIPPAAAAYKRTQKGGESWPNKLLVKILAP